MPVSVSTPLQLIRQRCPGINRLPCLSVTIIPRFIGCIRYTPLFSPVGENEPPLSYELRYIDLSDQCSSPNGGMTSSRLTRA
jgi:hypothetical protein